MPTAGTHITIVQRLAAASTQFRDLLGDPLADPETDEGRQARFACLGAVGPDVFYAMADYGSGLQDLENFLVKTAGTFQCIAETLGKLDRFVSGIESTITFGVSDELEKTSKTISAVIHEGLLALLVSTGANFWPVFEAARQKDKTRRGWFWADYLHYIRSGRFARRLLDNAGDNVNLRAYALGYLTHYVTDVVGHPYVNQVVQSPWRLYWQRHHLVENFIDVYVWDRWHVSRPASPGDAEPPLDAVTTTPNNPIGTGAPFTFARLNDHINIGKSTLGDPVDDIISSVCDKIDDGLFDVGIAEDTEQDEPDDDDFRAWTELMVKTLRDVYSNTTHPENLAPGRPDGFPTTEDVAAAYGAFRLLMRIATEEEINDPPAPNIIGDISAAVQQLLDDLQNNLSSFPPVPVPSTDGSFSWDALWDATKDFAEWLGESAAAVIKTVFDFIRDEINVAGTVLTEPIKYALWLLQKFLFSLYRQLRDVLVMAAYAVPFTNQLAINMGGPFNTISLWRSMVDLKPDKYPVEEIDEERAVLFSNYAPFVPPRFLTSNVEQPPVGNAAPYQPHVTGGGFIGRSISPTIPDDFIDAPIGPDDMFVSGAPQQAERSSDQRAPNRFGNQRNYGGAMANSARAIQLAVQGFPRSSTLPDYNLDGDRGYGWPTWDVEPKPTGDPPGGPLDANPNAGDPLNPTNPANVPPPGGEAHVNAVLATG